MASDLALACVSAAIQSLHDASGFTDWWYKERDIKDWELDARCAAEAIDRFIFGPLWGSDNGK